MFGPDVCTDGALDIDFSTQHRKLILEPSGGNGQQISRHRLGRMFLSQCEYTQEVDRQEQQGGVDTASAIQLPQSEHIARSQPVQTASGTGTLYA